MRGQQAKRRQHADRLQGRGFVALEYRRAEGAERGVRRDHLGQRATGEQQFPRRIPLAVGTRQRQIREPGLLTRPQVRGCDEAEHRVGDGPRIV